MNFRFLWIKLIILAGMLPFNLLSQVDAVTGLLATDCGNQGNAGDICVAFNKAANEDTISEYRIMVIPGEMLSTFTVEIASLIHHYTEVTPSGSDVSIRIEQQAPDVNGNPVVEEIEYYVFALSVAEDTSSGQNALSEPSNLLILSTPDYLYAGRADVPPLHYSDPEPDILIHAEWDSSQEYFLDLNGDGLDDYRFYCYFSGAMASYTRIASISGTAPDNRIISSQPLSNFLVNRFNQGDPLTFNDTLVSEQSFLSHYVYNDEQPDFTEGYWTGIEDKYAGLVMFNGTDTLVGWIKLSVPDYSTIQIKEYAWTVYSHHTYAAFTYEINDYEVSFTSLAEGESFVYWDFGDGTFSWERNPIHLYTQEKDYMVLHTAYSLSGSFMASETINICEMPTAGFIYELTKWGQLIILDQSSKAIKYRWDFGDGTSSTEASPEHYYQEDGTYPVSLLVTRGECTDSDSTVVDVCIYPKAEFYYEINGIEIYFYNTSLKADSLSWDFRDGSGSNESNPVHSFNVTGEYDVVLRTFNQCGQDSVTHMVYVGLEETDKDIRVMVYPIPASNRLFIEPIFPVNIRKAELFDPSGHLIVSIMDEKTGYGISEFDLSTVKNGFYILKLHLDHKLLIQKILVLNRRN